MDKVLCLTFASSLTKLCEINSSFDSGILKIAYHGLNRNNSYISKETFEKCIQTMYNCPIVCNYDRDTDTFGGHDMELVHDANGSIRLVNSTTPVGVIPESANWEWCEFEDDDGTIREYLCVECLIWKRQEAYQKIKNDGVTAHSMELTVKSGKSIEGVYHINDFEFTAFALIGVEPCFEGSSLEMFSKKEFKKQLTEMMQELKESYSLITPSNIGEIIKNKKYSTEGGKKVLDAKMELAASYNIDVDALDFSIEDFTLEELKEKFESMHNEVPTDDTDTPEHTEDKFALTNNVVEELCRVLGEVKIEREWGECTRYWYVDCDFDENEVYCWDSDDWLLYGFTYVINGDSISIDFESKKRKKYVIEDFEGSEQESPFAETFSELANLIHKCTESNTELEAKYQDASNTIESLGVELGELREFKVNVENDIARNACEEVFARFEDLLGNEAFEALRNECADDYRKYTLETLEEKCFAIRGRNTVIAAQFSHEPKTPKLVVSKNDLSAETEPYGGLFVKYGSQNK